MPFYSTPEALVAALLAHPDVTFSITGMAGRGNRVSVDTENGQPITDIEVAKRVAQRIAAQVGRAAGIYAIVGRDAAHVMSINKDGNPPILPRSAKARQKDKK